MPVKVKYTLMKPVCLKSEIHEIHEIHEIQSLPRNPLSN